MDDTIELGPEERDKFLGTGRTGVLALSSTGDEPPRSIPVSYGYDPTESVFYSSVCNRFHVDRAPSCDLSCRDLQTLLYFRLATGPDSEKGPLADRAVSFVTYGRDDGWRSVVARGRLEDVTEVAIAPETLNGLDHVDIPLLDVFDRPT
jgi:uncharacterized protein